MTAPAIAVVIPLFNRADRIADAVESVLGQTMGDFELVVVDDGSTDGSAEVVEALADKRLMLLRQPRNMGGNAARNRGIRESRAPILCFLDSDDAFLPHKLERVRTLFAERPKMDVLIDSFIKRWPGKNKPDAPMINPVLDDNRLILEALYTRRIYKATPGISCRRDAAERAGLFDEALKRRQDFDFLVRLARVGKLVSIDEPLWVKTYGGDAISAGVGGFMPALLAYHDRHPDYATDPVFRRGLAYDVARHAMRSLRGGRAGALRSELGTLSARIGKGAVAGLIVRGVFELAARDRRRKRAG